MRFISNALRQSSIRHWLLAVCCGLPTASWAVADDWTQWRGPNRTNRSAETGLFNQWDADGPPLAWTAEGLGEGYASVSVRGDRIYTTGNFDDGQSVVAVDARSGQVVWRTPVTAEAPKHSYEGSRCTPTIDGDRLYVVASDGRIVCLQAHDGRLIWSRSFDDWNGRMMSGWGYSESPLVDGAKVICTPGGPQGMIVALDKMTGDEIWACRGPQSSDRADANGKSLKSGAGYASPVISEGAGVRQYVQLVGQGLIGVQADTGKLLWHYGRVANATANIPTPIVDGDLIFTSTAYNTGSALLRLKPTAGGGVDAEEIYWLESRQLQNKHGGMVLVDGHIYCGHGNGTGLPICVNIKSGNIAWGPVRAEGKGEAGVTYADGHVVFRREDGTVMLVRATPERFDLVESFMPAFQQGKSWAHPVIANGRLYLREQNKLMAYEVGGR